MLRSVRLLLTSWLAKQLSSVEKTGIVLTCWLDASPDAVAFLGFFLSHVGKASAGAVFCGGKSNCLESGNLVLMSDYYSVFCFMLQGPKVGEMLADP